MNVHHPPFCVLLCLCCISRLVVEALTRLESSADDSIRHHHPCFTYDLLYYLLLFLLLFLCFCVNECEKNGCVDFFPRSIRLLSYRYRQFSFFCNFFFRFLVNWKLLFYFGNENTFNPYFVQKIQVFPGKLLFVFFLLLPQIC